MSLDGNVLGGAFATVLGTDLTNTTARCASCGRAGPIAETTVYDQAAGYVGRCPGCDDVMMTMVTTGDRTFVSFRGVSFLEFTS